MNTVMSHKSGQPGYFRSLSRPLIGPAPRKLAVILVAAGSISMLPSAQAVTAPRVSAPSTQGATPTTAPAPVGALTLTDGHRTVELLRPPGFVEDRLSSPTNRAVGTKESITHLTMLASDQSTDAGYVASFISSSQQTMKQAKGADLVMEPTQESSSEFAMVMHYRTKMGSKGVVDTIIRWRRVGHFAIQAQTEVQSEDETTIKSVNDAIVAMLTAAKLPGEAPAAAPQNNAAGPATGATAPAGAVENSPPREQLGGAVEFAAPATFEQVGTSKGGASKDYLSPDQATEIVVTLLPAGTPWDSSTAPLQLNVARRELEPEKPTTAPELITGGKVPVEIRWSMTKEGKPATGFRLFRKVGKRIARCDVTTGGDAGVAQQTAEQVLLSMAPTQGSEETSTNPGKPADAKTNQRAQAALDQAKKLSADHKDDEAYAKYKLILNEYPTSTAATEARQAVDNFEADPTFLDHHKKPTTGNEEEKAAGIIAMADNYAALGRTDAAKEKYQQVINLYPNAPSAAKAKKRLAELGTAH